MSAKPAASNRPLSPFMIGPYYRPQITSMLSITHRLTGVALTLGSVFLAVWVLSAAAGPTVYARWEWLAGGIGGKVLLFGWTWALLYHLCNGIRHLVWDTGRAFSLDAVTKGGIVVVVASIISTIAVWVAAYML
jgi:succinate dehydrogenase / fumarate reductase cytochrome b subunit